jgi:hypothetical protein
MAGIKPLQVQREYLWVIFNQIDCTVLRLLPVSLHRVAEEQRAACDERFMDSKFLLRIVFTDNYCDNGRAEPEGIISYKCLLGCGRNQLT